MDVVLDYGVGVAVTTGGSVSIGGELSLVDAEMLPPIEPLAVFQENWRSRADTPRQMTGTFENRITAVAKPR